MKLTSKSLWSRSQNPWISFTNVHGMLNLLVNPLTFSENWKTSENIWAGSFFIFIYFLRGRGGGHYGPSRLFHSFWAESIVRWGENGRSPDHLQAEVGLSHMWPELGSNQQRWDENQFRVLKISVLNQSSTGAACVKGVFITYANSEGSDEPAHPQSRQRLHCSLKLGGLAQLGGSLTAN